MQIRSGKVYDFSTQLLLGGMLVMIFFFRLSWSQVYNSHSVKVVISNDSPVAASIVVVVYIN